MTAGRSGLPLRYWERHAACYDQQLTGPVISASIRQQLAIPAEHIRLDRSYQEVEATADVILALCDLFGMSIFNAVRWAITIDHITATPSANAKNQPLGGH